MVDTSNMASNLGRRRKSPTKGGIRYGIPEGEPVVKVSSFPPGAAGKVSARKFALPPGIAKKRAGMQSARSFAPGQIKKGPTTVGLKRVGAGPNPNTGTAPTKSTAAGPNIGAVRAARATATQSVRVAKIKTNPKRRTPAQPKFALPPGIAKRKTRTRSYSRKRR